MQLARRPNVKILRDINERLTKYLRDDDEFWPRWRFFFESLVGVEKE